jgi:GT2 family glycosyltransferase
MNNKFDITASIVLYRNNPEILSKSINSFLGSSLRIKLYLIDNSPTDQLQNITHDPRCEYIFCNENLGFGKAHNIALRKSLSESRYHVVLNPDVYFNPEALIPMFTYLETHADVGQLMPKVLYPDGQIQYSGKLIPTPLNLIGRRFLGRFEYVKKKNRLYELKDYGYDTIINVPNHLGCFMLLRTEALKEVGLFDERIFMYTEDVDLTRRMHQKYKTIFFPGAAIYHHYERGSYKNPKLLFYHIRSAIQYFNKWGWFFDKERAAVNKNLLNEFGRL